MSRRVMWYMALFVIALVGSGTYWYGETIGTPIIEPERITKPHTDVRQYERVTLENGLNLLVISDPTATVAAVAVQVQAGSWQDALTSPGLAHLASEVLFFKGDTLNKANPFEQLIQQHGGTLATQLSGQATTFHYDINASALAKTLDAMAAAFIQPSWTTLDMNRAVARIDAEYQTNLFNDALKRSDAQQTALNQAHPAARFAEGNRETLQALDLELDLRRYVQDFYTPDNLSLVVLGSSPTAVLVDQVNVAFGAFQGKKLPTSDWPEYYSSKQLPTFLQIVPSHSTARTLTFSFPVTQTQGAEKFIQYWLQQNHGGSLKERLLAKGWIIDLDSGLTHGNSSAATFDIRIVLTRSGEKAIMEVGTWVFDSLQLIAQQGVPAWQLSEFNSSQQRRFTYLETQDALTTVTQAVKTLGKFNELNTLSAPIYNANVDAIAIANFVKHLKVDRLMLTWESPAASASDKTAFYQADFDVGPLPFDWAQTWNAAAIDPVFLPALSNAFTPKTLQQNPAIMDASTLYDYLPDIRIKNAGMTYYYLNNDGFNSPRSNVHFVLSSPWFTENNGHRAATQLYLALVNDAVAAMARQADAAGINMALTHTPEGIEFKANGFQESLGILTNIVADTLVSVDPKTPATDRLRAALRQQLQASEPRTLSQQLSSSLSQLLLINAPSPNDLDSALSRVTVADLIEVQQHIQSGSHLTVMLVGNALPAEGDILANRLQASFSPESPVATNLQIAQLDRTTAHWPLDNESRDSGLLMYFQGESDSYRERALYHVMARLMALDFVTALRDGKQLGTQMTAQAQMFALLPGMTLQVLSPDADPGLLLLHVDKFLKDYLQTLLAMNPDVFNTYRDGAIARLVQPSHNLSEQADQWWSDIHYQVPHLNRDKRLALEMEKISHTGFIRFYQNQILNPDARRIIIYQAGTMPEEASKRNYPMQPGDRVISTAQQYQSKRPVFQY